MLLRYIRYHNFRPFIGDQEINLTTPDNDRNANTIVILGDNTFGKSTFVLSFIWCFYGISRFQRPKDILNAKVVGNMSLHESETASVEVGFTDNDINYTIKRTQKFTMGTSGLISQESRATLTFVDANGETKRLGEHQYEVNEAMDSILPANLSQFFFFEGEKNNEIKKSDLADSVKTLLGLDAYEKMLFHLYGNTSLNSPSSTSVMGDYLSKQNSESDDKARAEYQKKIESERELENIVNRLNEITDNIKNYEDRIETINNKLIEAAPSAELKNSIKDIEKELKYKEADLESSYKDFLKRFSTESQVLFLNPTLNKAQDRMAQMDVVDKGIKGIEGPAIYELLKRGSCLCGTDLSKGTQAYKNVEQYIEFLPPKNVGSIVSEVTDSIDSNREKCESFVESFESDYKKILRIRNRINELERAHKAKMLELAKIGDINTTEIENELYDNKSRISKLRSEERELRNKKLAIQSAIETADRNFNLYKSNSDRAKAYNKYYMYAEAVYKCIWSFYSGKEKELRMRLGECVKEMFDNMYTGKREVSIDSKYNIVMKYNNGDIDDTGGLRVIQYFAYVGGLVKLARQVMNEHDEVNASLDSDDDTPVRLGEHYPLVLDAAFSHADDKHIKTISKELSGATEQLLQILIVR